MLAGLVPSFSPAALESAENYHVSITSFIASFTCRIGKYFTSAFHLSGFLSLHTELAVTFDVDYTPPFGFVGGPNDYRAASGGLTITCQATGGSGPVTYLWTSTCSTGCFISSATEGNEVVGRGSLQSVDSGNHTCTVTDSDGGEIGNATIEINVVGE